MISMSIGIDTADLDLPSHGMPQVQEEPGNTRPEIAPLEIGSIVSKALYSVWSGAPVTIVNSPPGGGKTTAVVQVVRALVERGDFSVTLVTPTRRGGADIAGRIAEAVGPDAHGLPQVQMRITGMTLPEGVGQSSADEEDGRQIPTVRTIASAAIAPPECDLLIVDEAYQATFADVSAAADKAQQILLVGDPGQIGPVITADTRMFDGRDVAPHLRAPDVFSRMHDCDLHSISQTFRLGQETVNAIAPLYDFTFQSSRPDRWLDGGDGEGASEILTTKLPVAARVDDPDTMRAVAEAAADLVGVNLYETQPDGSVTVRALEQEHVAVVVSHNSQLATITAMLGALQMGAITVGTADSMQGGQWHAVVALDPFVGHTTASDHQLSTGRLCVMASRHMSFLHWMHDGKWEETLNDPGIDRSEAKKARTVRRHLTAE